MAGLYIFIIMIFRVVQSLFGKRASVEIKNPTMMIGYISYRNLISTALGLLLILLGGNGFKVDLLTVVIATFSGLTLFFAGYCSIYALKSGTISLDAMFGTAGMIIPIIAGAVLFDKPITPLQIMGLGLFFVAAYLLIGASKKVYTNFSYKTLLLLLGSLVANGGTMLAQQMFTAYVPDGDVSAFSFFSFGTIGVLSGLVYTGITATRKVDRESTKMSKASAVCGVALAISVFVINQLATISTALVSPVILFTFINGGGTIISTVIAAIVYKEKIQKKTAIGVALGIISLVVIKMFE